MVSIDMESERHSASGMPDQNVDTKNIEPYIFPIVEALNNAGFKTRASCQGHFTPMGLSTAYVSFCSPSIDLVERFDSALNNTKLWLPWNLDASFGKDRTVWWRLYVYNNALRPQPPLWFPKLFGQRWLSRYRTSMSKDAWIISNLANDL